MSCPAFRVFVMCLALLGLPGSTRPQAPLLRHRIDSLNTLLRTSGQDTDRVKLLLELSRVALDTSVIQALQYATEAGTSSETLRWNTGRIRAAFAEGACYDAVQQWDKALDCYTGARELAQASGDKDAVMTSYLKSCYSFSMSRHGDEVAAQHLEALAAARRLQDTLAEVKLLTFLGGHYYGRQDYQRALYYWRPAPPLAHQLHRINGEAVTLNNMGEAYGYLGMADSARWALDSALKLIRTTSDHRSEAVVHNGWGLFYAGRKQTDSAIRWFRSGLELASGPDGEKPAYEFALERLSDLYEAAGRPDSALAYYRRYIGVRDSIRHEERLAEETRTVMRYDFERQTAAGELERKSLRLKSKRQTYALVAAGIGLALLGLVTVVYRSLMRRDRRKAETIAAQALLLQEQKHAIQRSLEEKERLMREIHHRVKNNLQVISALLQLQSKRSSDPAVKAALDESQNRMLSIAFIHQNLYQHADLKSVEMRSFLAELVHHLAGVYGHAAQQLTIREEVSVAALNIDLAIPLGLIINELLTNSYKYAFQGRGEVTINIRLIPDPQPGYCRLEYRDDGPGLPPGMAAAKSKTLGLTLVNDLCRQLDGIAQYQAPPGFGLTLAFPCNPDEPA